MLTLRRKVVLSLQLPPHSMERHTIPPTSGPTDNPMDSCHRLSIYIYINRLKLISFFDLELCSHPPQCLNSPVAVHQAISCSHTSTRTASNKPHHDEWRTAYFSSTYDSNSRNGSNGSTKSTTCKSSSVNQVENSVNLKKS
jgi:hypothetical protein